MIPHTHFPRKKCATSCPRFDSCNAPICPLDNWQPAQHLRGEPICLWLREAVKSGGIARIATAATSDIAETVAESLQAIMASSSDIRHKLKQASRHGSKIENMCAARKLTGKAAMTVRLNTSNPAVAVHLLAASNVGRTDGSP
jgi:hypothetical protein